MRSILNIFQRLIFIAFDYWALDYIRKNRMYAGKVQYEKFKVVVDDRSWME